MNWIGGDCGLKVTSFDDARQVEAEVMSIQEKHSELKDKWSKLEAEYDDQEDQYRAQLYKVATAKFSVNDHVVTTDTAGAGRRTQSDALPERFDCNEPQELLCIP